MAEAEEFFEAVRKGEAERIREFLARDRSLINAKTERGFSPVTVAAYYGQREALKTILAHKPMMTVHEAALAGDLERVRQLVDADQRLANDTSSPDGFPPLGLAAYAGQARVVKYLIAQGADVNFALPGMGFSALTGAVSESQVEAVKVLVAAGANVNQVYENGEASVLTTAAANGNVDIIKVLLDAGADVNLRIKDGKSPLAMAVEKGHEQAAELIRSRGGTE